ncbi:hypothetical protein HNR50_004446 [Spirochaeta isovalerica]|uniref:Uncharacterized protein n=1 Tax=Spirochaeta isovalerica TaxID=150 RepID=A0A841RJ49_9SPIO|nr:hypothetical protein [Spirochaeta isovalerica]
MDSKRSTTDAQKVERFRESQDSAHGDSRRKNNQ